MVVNVVSSLTIRLRTHKKTNPANEETRFESKIKAIEARLHMNINILYCLDVFYVNSFAINDKEEAKTHDHQKANLMKMDSKPQFDRVICEYSDLLPNFHSSYIGFVEI